MLINVNTYPKLEIIQLKWFFYFAYNYKYK